MKFVPKSNDSMIGEDDEQQKLVAEKDCVDMGLSASSRM
jgi:hypothetical protein